MPQLRKDPVTSRWVIVNTENPKGTSALKREGLPRSSKICPFCPGHETMTPPEILAYGRPPDARVDSAAWQLRVVPNKFPALRIEENPVKTALGVYDKLGGFGAHEVIIETPDHEKDIPDLPVAQVELILRAYRDRCLDLKKDARLKYILIFKNHGAPAGASLEHPHSQLVALPIVPSRVVGEVQGALKYHQYTERCIFCDMLHDQSAPQLTLYQEGQYVAMAPFASRFPFETWVLPTAHQARFETLTEEQIRSLAKVLKVTLSKMKHALADPPFNFMIHTLPIQGEEEESFHWHLEIIPQLVEVTGFEMATGFYINPTPPELAAETLRQWAVGTG